MASRGEILKTLQAHEIEPATEFLLALATAGQMEEEEFWEMWGLLEAFRRFYGMPTDSAPVN